MHSQDATSCTSKSKKRKLEEISPSEDGTLLEARKSLKRLKLSQEDYDVGYKPSKSHADSDAVLTEAAAVEPV